jgi:O-antigen/teichoic acid export membrane protein
MAIPDETTPVPSETSTTKKHIRGSSLLLVGRLISLGLNFVVQVVTVRYLSKGDYGAFAYALSVVSMGASIVLLSLDKAVSRFVPIYHEQQNYRKLSGAVMLSFGAIVGTGLILVLLAVGLQELLVGTVIQDPLAGALLMILVALAPIEGLEFWFQSMLAIFAKPRAIFFRRHLLGPALKLAAVLVVIVLKGNVYHLAFGYLIGGILGILVYVGMLYSVLRKQGLLTYFSLKQTQWPVREIFGFSLPLLSSDLVFILRNNLVVVFLEYFRTTTDVAEFRAVLPVARLNLLVLQSFTFLFTPLAARLYAREDHEGINDLYWQTAVWISVLTFPVFVVTFSLAEPVTVLLFGQRYAQSGINLALLSFGYYVNAALGFNSYTLRVYGRVRYIVIIDMLAAAIGLGINLLLIPRFGAVGAAIGTSGTLVVHNLLNHAGLLVGTKIRLFDWRYLKVYVSIVLGALTLLLVQLTVSPIVYISIVLAAAISLGVLRLNRKVLNIEQTFPELLRVPGFRWLLSS